MSDTNSVVKEPERLSPYVTLDGNQLRRLRMRAGYTVRGFAAQIGISPGHLSGLETDRSNTSAPVARRIADALGVEPEVLEARDAE